MATVKSWICSYCGCPNWNMKATKCEGNCEKPRRKNARVVNNVVVGTCRGKLIS